MSAKPNAIDARIAELESEKKHLRAALDEALAGACVDNRNRISELETRLLSMHKSNFDHIVKLQNQVAELKGELKCMDENIDTLFSNDKTTMGALRSVAAGRRRWWEKI